MLISLNQLKAAAERTTETRAAWLEGFEQAVGNPNYRADIDNATASGRYCEPWLWDIDGIELDREPVTPREILKAAREYVRQSEVRDYIGEAFGYAA